MVSNIPPENILDQHTCEELLSQPLEEEEGGGDRIVKWKYSGWMLELDEGINMHVNFCHLCGVKLE